MPRGYKAHAAPTPLLGGLIVAAASCAGTAWAVPGLDGTDLAVLSALVAGSALILLIGLVDDMHDLSPGWKLLSQVAATAAAGACLLLVDARLELFLAWPPVPVVALTVVWIVAITNAFNFLDNMDGLCAGLGAIAATALALLNWHSGEMVAALTSAALAGACLGFLPANWPLARVFLGDTGSMFIGFALAVISVMGMYTRGAEGPVLVAFAPLLVFAVPLLDTLLVVLLRLQAGHPPWLGDRRHLNHRLVRRGLPARNAVLTLWAVSAGCGAVAVSLPMAGPVVGMALVLGVLLTLVILAYGAGTEGLSS